MDPGGRRPPRSLPARRSRPRAAGRLLPRDERQRTPPRPVRPRHRGPTWTRRAVDTARVLAADSVQKVGNGHPGTAMSLAPAAYLLFQRFLRHDPADPELARAATGSCSPAGTPRSRSTSSSSCPGYGLELSDLQSFRTWGSLTPGHPERHHTAGVETTTGPLGQGLATAVGMAMGAALRARTARPRRGRGHEPVRPPRLGASPPTATSRRASPPRRRRSPARRSSATSPWSGTTTRSRSRTTPPSRSARTSLARYAAYGWHVQSVDVLPDGDVDVVGLAARARRGARRDRAARRSSGCRPSSAGRRRRCATPSRRTALPSAPPRSPPPRSSSASTRSSPSRSPTTSSPTPAPSAPAAPRCAPTGTSRYAAWRAAQPDRAALLDRLVAGTLPADLTLPEFPAGKDVATRKASGEVIQAIAAALPELVGGSADLAESNNTTIEGAPSFLPEGTVVSADVAVRQEPVAVRPDPALRHPRARDGLGPERACRSPTCCARSAARSSCSATTCAARCASPRSCRPTSPTSGRTTPSASARTARPTSRSSTCGRCARSPASTWSARPTPTRPRRCGARSSAAVSRPASSLTRQNLPTLDRTVAGARVGRSPRRLRAGRGQSAARPACCCWRPAPRCSSPSPRATRSRPTASPTRVVSMPCLEWFEEQDADYRESVLPSSVRARVSVEAGHRAGLVEVPRHRRPRRLARALRRLGGLPATLFREFGITADAVVAAAHDSLAAAAH